MNKLFTALLISAAALVMAGATLAEEADPLMVDSHLAYYYADEGGHAKVTMTIVDKKGRERERVFWMLRRDLEDMGDQNYYTYFVKPADVRGTAFLVHKHPDGNDDRWLYMPALDLVKRIAADDRSASFVGSDFSYEDVSGRVPTLDKHEILGEEAVGERATIKVKSTPKDGGSAEWSHKISWICKETKLPLKEEYYGKGEAPERVFTLENIEMVGGHATGFTRTMKDVKRGKHTVIQFDEIEYNADLDATDFSERLLKSPPRKYTR